MNPALSSVANCAERLENLKANQARYEYDYSLVAPLALLKQVSAEENFSLIYTAERLPTSAVFVANIAAVYVHELFDLLDNRQDYEDYLSVLLKHLPAPITCSIGGRRASLIGMNLYPIPISNPRSCSIASRSSGASVAAKYIQPALHLGVSLL